MTDGHASGSKTNYSRIQLLIILLTPLIVMAASTALYYSGWLVPDERVNYGELLDPVLTVEDLGLELEAVNPERQWLWIQTAIDCDAACLEEVARQRQIQVALGKYEPRVKRVLLTETTGLDKLSRDYPGMSVVNRPAADYSASFRDRIPAEFGRENFIFVVDPLGNIPLYFTPANDYKEQLEDMKHLLKLSTIG